MVHPVLLPVRTLTGLEREQRLPGTVAVAVVLCNIRHADFGSYLHHGGEQNEKGLVVA